MTHRTVGAPGQQTRRPATGRGTPFVLAFGLYAAVLLLWVLANPPMAAPDEPAHVVRAAAVVRGQPMGDPDPDRPGVALVRVPALYAYALTVPTCFAFRSNTAAGCVPDPPADPDATTTASTWVTEVNPLYHVAVGVPTLLPGSTATFAVMRCVSALLCAAALAWGAHSLGRLTGSRWVALGYLAAMSPMVVFLGSVVNPAGLEVACAAALWVCLLVLGRSPDLVRAPHRSELRAHAAGVAVLAIGLAATGGLGPLYVVLIVAAAVLATPGPAWSTLAREPEVRRWALVGAVGVAGSAAWSRAAGSAAAFDAPGSPGALRERLVVSVARIPADLTGMLGELGWLDTPLPPWLYLALVLGAGFVVVLAVLLAPRARDVAAIAGVGVLALALPVVVRAFSTDAAAGAWQGRYALPLAVGLPVVAGFVTRDGVGGGGSVGDVGGGDGAAPAVLRRRSVLVLPAVVLVVGHVGAFAVNLHRYVRGTGGSWILAAPDDWVPPLPAPVLVAAYAAAVVGLAAVLVVRRGDHGAPVPVAAGRLDGVARRTADGPGAGAAA